MPLLWLLIVLPLVELFVLIQVGARIGAFATIVLSLFTAALGVWLVQQQGFGILMRLQAACAEGELPALELIDGALLLIAGLCLLVPGFLTDGLGLVLLIPPFRRWLTGHVIQIYPGVRPPQRSGPRVIEGEFRRED
ncbi:FxsA family protein [Caldichromatium japonicum]|uniref:FxsA family protein n=1 Tax=Caldichromatium japonicum TaxID=2699430 RepID=A0A6G7VDJ5_9GAMM|nr:FxsA family protein [Caldichromatium japonicum]QIK38091.1 FxsA family protein [Caldichromatium japonicum]